MRLKAISDLNYYACPDCGSGTTLIKRHDWNRPCPKCDGQTEIDIYGKPMLWD
jgi:Zn finger protein HypA/HybF involved in hydrogenase expression